MRRASILFVLALGLLLLPPAASSASQPSSSGASAHRAEYGYPWLGSYLRSSLSVTSTRVVWLKWRGTYSTWADGGPDWDVVWENTNMGVNTGKVTGAVSKVLAWEWPTMEGGMDVHHPQGGIYTSAGRVKVRLTPGNGKKVVTIRYNLKIVDQINYCNFVPYYPVSPNYTKTIKLAM